MAKLSVLFGGLALLVASVGLYGLLSYGVASRTNEIGIRMALGGRARDILLMVLRQAGWIIVSGLAIGVAVAFALTRLIASMLFEITASDVTTYVAISILLLLISLIACLIHARRAAVVDPVLALKHE